MTEEQNKGLDIVGMVKQLDIAIEADDEEARKNTGYTEELDDALRALDLMGIREALLKREPATEAVLELERQFMKLAASRQEIIQNGICAYMSPRPNGLWVPWVMVEELLSAYSALKGKGASQGVEPKAQYGNVPDFDSLAQRKPSGK